MSYALCGVSLFAAHSVAYDTIRALGHYSTLSGGLMERTGKSLAFGLRLRGMRNAKDLKAKDVTGYLKCSESLVYSIEGGYRTISPASLNGLLKGPYQRPDLIPYMSKLLNQIIDGDDQPIRDAPMVHPNVMLVHELEQESTAAFGMIIDQVPKLAQTADYMRAQHRMAGHDAVTVEGLTQAGLERQDRFFNLDDPPHTHILITEGAIERARKINGQIDLLVGRAEHRALTIQVIPNRHGPHPVFCSFTVMDFDEFPGILWSDSVVGGTLSDKAGDIATARSLWDALLHAAISPTATWEMIRSS